MAELLEQLDWTGPVEDSTLVGDRKLLTGIVEGALTDVGGELDQLTDLRPFNREDFEGAVARAEWLMDWLAELGSENGRGAT